MSRLYLEEICEWYRFTDQPVAGGILSFPIGRRNKVEFFGFMNDCVDKQQFTFLDITPFDLPDDIRKTRFPPSVALLQHWCEVYDRKGNYYDKLNSIELDLLDMQRAYKR